MKFHPRANRFLGRYLQSLWKTPSWVMTSGKLCFTVCMYPGETVFFGLFLLFDIIFFVSFIGATFWDKCNSALPLCWRPEAAFFTLLQVSDWPTFCLLLAVISPPWARQPAYQVTCLTILFLSYCLCVQGFFFHTLKHLLKTMVTKTLHLFNVYIYIYI